MEEIIKEMLSEGATPEEIADELFTSEYNYNNCDITSGQQCYDYSELLDIINKDPVESFLEQLQDIQRG